MEISIELFAALHPPTVSFRDAVQVVSRAPIQRSLDVVRAAFSCVSEEGVSCPIKLTVRCNGVHYREIPQCRFRLE